MEFCDGGSLFGLVRTAGKLDVAEADCFFRQLVLGLQYMHSRGVTHRNLKPENIVLTGYGTLKIIDLSCAEKFHTPDFQCVGLRGSLPYIAPEAFAVRRYGARAAVWALAIIYFIMVAGTRPWRIARSDDGLYAHYIRARQQGSGSRATRGRAQCEPRCDFATGPAEGGDNALTPNRSWPAGGWPGRTVVHPQSRTDQTCDSAWDSAVVVVESSPSLSGVKWQELEPGSKLSPSRLLSFAVERERHCVRANGPV